MGYSPGMVPDRFGYKGCGGAIQTLIADRAFSSIEKNSFMVLPP